MILSRCLRILPCSRRGYTTMARFAWISWGRKKPKLDRYRAGGRGWKAAVFSGIERGEDLKPRGNQLESPLVGVVPPMFDQRGFWRSSDIWFPTPALHKRFPGLA